MHASEIGELVRSIDIESVRCLVVDVSSLRTCQNGGGRRQSATLSCHVAHYTAH